MGPADTQQTPSTNVGIGLADTQRTPSTNVWMGYDTEQDREKFGFQ